jgi:BMFP domain-containing protein YqiC
MGRLDELRARARAGVSVERDAALTALFTGVPAWFVVHRMATGSWIQALAAMVVGPMAMGVLYLGGGSILERSLGRRRADVAAWIATIGVAALWWFSRYRILGLLPLAASAIPYLVTLRSARGPGELPRDLASSLAGLPRDLEPALRERFDRALADRDHLEETLARELSDDGAVDSAALRADVAAALRAMLDRAVLLPRLDAAARGGSDKLAAAAADARGQIARLGGEISAATEALLLYAAARQPAQAETLRARADQLRATAAGLAEFADLEPRV